MGVLSRLLWDFVPKSFTGLFLCVLPLATAIVVIAYPQTVVKLFLTDEEPLEPLDGDLTSLASTNTESKKKRRKGSKTKNFRKKEESKAEVTVSEENIEEKPELEELLVDEKSEEDSLLELASIQGKIHSISNPIKSKLTSSNNAAAKGIPASPALKQIEMSDEESWSRVPTKQEEAIASLKNRLAFLSEQLKDSTALAEELQEKLDKESVRANEAEKELKERSRVYQIRWVEMEGDIRSLRTVREELTKKLQNMEVANTQFTEQKNSLLVALQSRISELETANGLLSSLKRAILLHEGSEKQLTTQIAHLEGELSRAVDGAFEEKMAWKNEKEELQSRLNNVEGQLFILKATRDQAQNEIALLKEQLEASRAGVTVLTDKNERLAKDLQCKEDEATSLKESVSNTTVEFEKFKDIWAAKDTAHEKLAKEKNEAIESLIKARTEIEQLTNELDEARKKETTKIADNEEKEELEKKVAELETEIGECRKDIAKLELEKTALESLQQERFELAAKLEDAEKIAKDHLANLQKAEKRNNILQNVAETKYKAYQQEITGLEGEISLLKSKLDGFAQSTDLVEKLVSESCQ